MVQTTVDNYYALTEPNNDQIDLIIPVYNETSGTFDGPLMNIFGIQTLSLNNNYTLGPQDYGPFNDSVSNS